MDKHKEIDKLEYSMREYPSVDCPLKHTFVPGMYIRKIFMPAKTTVTSLIHKTQHPYFIMKGKELVYSDTLGEQILEAGFDGITVPGTRRVLYIIEDCIWITCHATNIIPENDSEEAIQKAVYLIGEDIIDWRENPLLGG